MSDIVNQILDHIEILESIVTLKEFFIILGSIFLVIINMIKFFYIPKENNPLNYRLSKDQLKPLKYYVPTKGQLTLPTNDSNDEKERFLLMDFFIDEVFKKNTNEKYFIVLGESGMGKSTFLQKLYLKYRRTIFKTHKIAFCPLTNSPDVSQWSDIQNKSNTILLLDALDEDQKVVADYDERMTQIINTTKEFYKVIITCRTQFFQDEQSEPKDTSLINYNTKSKKLQFHKIYISKFNDEDINIFLKKRYGKQKEKINQAKAIIEKCSDLMARPMILSYIDELINNPEIYSCITDIYEKLIFEWIHREPGNEELLRQFTNHVMRYMFINDTSYITQDIIGSLCKKEDIEIINPILARTRSLLNRNCKGEYHFAHKSIYEYLISYEAIYSDTSLRKKLVDLDKSFDFKFYQEMSQKNIISGSKNLRYFNLTNLDSTNLNLSNADLTGADLSNMDLNGFDLSDTVLKRSCLKNTNFKKADLTNADLEGASFNKTDFSEATLKNTILEITALKDIILSDKNLSGFILIGSIPKSNYLYGKNLSNATLDGINLKQADLTNTILAHTTFNNVNLDSAILKNADLTNANLNKINLSNTNLEGAVLTNANFKSAVFKNSNLTNTKLTGTILTNANLDSAILTNEDLTSTILTGAILTNANLDGANLKGIELANIKLKGSTLSNTNLSSSNIKDSDLSNCNLINAILRNAYLENVNLEYANLSHTNLKRAKLTNVYLQNACLFGANLTEISSENANFAKTNLTKTTIENVFFLKTIIFLYLLLKTQF